MTRREQILEVCEFDEEWLPVQNYPNYLISNFGRVMSNWRNGNGKFKLLKIKPNQQGYIRSMFVGPDFKRKNINVHRLVAEHFIGPRPTKYHVVCHLNDIKTNNVVTNLHWGTSKENSHMAKMNDRLRRGQNHPNAKLTDKDVKYILKNHFYVNNYNNNTRKLAQKFNVASSTIARVIKPRPRPRRPKTTSPLDELLEGEK